MEKSATIKELATALAKAQATLQAAKKGSVNPHFQYKYADLLSVWDACREALTANGLSVAQMADVDEEGKTVLETILMHTSGEWIMGRLPVLSIKADPQGQGSAITYARRYSLSAIIGLCTEGDDDGEAAMDRGKAKAPSRPPADTDPGVIIKEGGRTQKTAPGFATQKQKDDLAKFDKGRIAELMEQRGFPRQLTKLNADILLTQLIAEQETKDLPEIDERDLPLD